MVPWILRLPAITAASHTGDSRTQVTKDDWIRLNWELTYELQMTMGMWPKPRVVTSPQYLTKRGTPWFPYKGKGVRVNGPLDFGLAVMQQIDNNFMSVQTRFDMVAKLSQIHLGYKGQQDPSLLDSVI